MRAHFLRQNRQKPNQQKETMYIVVVVVVLFIKFNFISSAAGEIVSKSMRRTFFSLFSFDYNYLAELHYCVILTKRVHPLYRILIIQCNSTNQNRFGCFFLCVCVCARDIHLCVRNPVTISSNATGAINCPQAMPSQVSHAKIPQAHNCIFA